ncbi:MAG: phenylalanine--tRNA ligase subunit alpha [Clostridia bacterium]|nr:phenylalanine--tRNA ligase subunit alpha [Clostridia bacterium]
MKEKLKDITARALLAIDKADNNKDLAAVKVEILGKSGELTGILRNMKDLSPEDRPLAGKLVNEARVEIERAFDAKFKYLHDLELAKKLEEEKIDITIEGSDKKLGGLHPLTQMQNDVIDFFTSLGFAVLDSPEIETDYYNFEALNVPANHPARDMQDTFYVTDSILLRTQTSAGQIRYMENKKPPLKMINIGRVFRSDDVDATHSPVFHQIEGLVVDKHITMCDLKGILAKFAQRFFGEKTQIRFRPSYFPFTEPSVEVDASCPYCGGKGCRVCKGTGWIEILGAGIVNRNVLATCDINPDEFTGFAFGIGLDRITTICHGINDMRLEFENDIRFLKQFN